MRTGSEREFANKEEWYGRRRMSTRGLEEACMYAAIHNITILITVLTAFKTGRPDLIRMLMAFTMI